MATWRNVKESLILAELSAAEQAALEEPKCYICTTEDLNQLTTQQGGLFSFRFCDCKLTYCHECITKWWNENRAEGSNGPGDYCPCPQCKKKGIPLDRYFPYHVDYIGDVAAKEIKEDFVFIDEDAPVVVGFLLYGPRPFD